MKKISSLTITVLLIFSMFSMFKLQVKSVSSPPVGYWKFDEGTGTTTSDSSGNGHDGTVYGASWTNGISNGALHFDGVSNYVEVPSSPSLSGFTQLTLEAWIKVDTLSMPKGYVVAKSDGYVHPNPNDEYGLFIAARAVNFHVADGGTGYLVGDPSPDVINEVNRWYYLAATWSGLTYTIYVDGNVVSTGNAVPGTSSSGSAPLTIGQIGHWSWTYFQGVIDEVKIYDYARTAEEIWNDYSSVMVSLPWKDDFDYATKEDMKAAGWALDGEVRISVGGGVVTLDNDGVAGCGIKYAGHFPSGINDFLVEAKSKWIGRAYGQRIFYVWTQRHRYGWYGDGYYPEYSFIRYSDGWGGDDVKVLRFGGYAPVINEWATFALEKRGNVFYMYENGILKNTYTETDSAPDELVAVSISGGWISTVEYDYISVETPPSVRAWKDETSFGLENDRLLLHGSYSAYPGDRIWFDYLIFKDTGTKWTSPWDDIFVLYAPLIHWADKTTIQIAAFNYGDEAKLTYFCDIPNCPWPCPPVHVDLEIVIREDSYIYWTAQVTNIGPSTERVPIGLTLYTYIAGDTANDYYYVPGHGQGQFIGTQQNINYDPSENWAAVWDEAKQEGCGIITTQGFSELNIQISDWYALTAVSEMVHLQEWHTDDPPGIILAPGEKSPIYNCYYYFYEGTGWQKAKDFYDTLAPVPDFEISVSPDQLVASPGFASSFIVTVESINGFSSPVHLEVIPDSVELSSRLSSDVLEPPSGGSDWTTFTVSILSTDIVAHTIDIVGTDNGITHKKAVQLDVPFMSVPYLSQGDVDWCLPTSVAMVLRFNGKSVHQAEAASGLGVGHDPRWGWERYLSRLTTYLNDQGLGYEVCSAEEWTRANLKVMLDEGELVLLTIRDESPVGLPPTYEFFHTVVVTGYHYESDRLFIHDPSGALVSLGESSWWDDGVFHSLSTYTEMPYMYVPVLFSDLEDYLTHKERVIDSWVGVHDHAEPSIGELNIIGGDGTRYKTVSISHDTYQPWHDDLYIWWSGAEPGSPQGLEWAGRRFLDPNDYLAVHIPPPPPWSGDFQPPIVNPTDISRSYQFEVTFSKSGVLKGTSGRLPVENVVACSMTNTPLSRQSPLRVGDILSESGWYVISLKLYGLEGLLLDQIDLPRIKYHKRDLKLSLDSPANLFATDPIGRSVGVDPSTGETVNEIPDAFYSGAGTEPQIVMIPDPINDTYNIILVGTATGNYTFIIEYITSAETITQTFSGTISPQEQQHYSALISETGEMTAISWEYVFKDLKRSTMLKISTDDKYFQFVAPEKDFGVKYDPNMKTLYRFVIIRYEDSEMRLIATAIDKDFDFCSAVAWDKQTRKCYLLIDKPNWQFWRYCCCWIE